MNTFYKIFLISILVASAGTIALQVPAISQTRAKNHDRTVSNDLLAIHTAIQSMEQTPEKLSEVDTDGIPEDHLDNYTYKVDSQSYELCAKFKTDTRSSNPEPQENKDTNSDFGFGYDDYTTDYEDFQTHNKGEHCFTLDTSPYSNSASDYLRDFYQYDIENSNPELLTPDGSDKDPVNLQDSTFEM